MIKKMAMLVAVVCLGFNAFFSGCNSGASEPAIETSAATKTLGQAGDDSTPKGPTPVPSDQ